MEPSIPTPKRRQYTAQERQQFVALYGQSGMTLTGFAKQHGIKLTTLRQWLHGRKAPRKSSRPAFQEVFLPPSLSGGATEIILGHDFTVRFATHATAPFIAQVVNALRGPC